MNRKLLLLMAISGLAVNSFAQTEYSFTATTGYDDNGTTRYTTGTYSTWSNTSTTAQLSDLDNPIIIVEGYDPEDSYQGLDIFFLFDDPIAGRLGTRLRNLGYDLVVVDFDDDNTRHIQQNAMFLVDFITEVNNNKVGTNENVVIGVSMGGLISRYALAYMEENNLSHDTRLFGTFDTPHRGANISPTSQMAVTDFANTGLLLALTNGQSLNAALELDAPAVEQMLIYHEPSFVNFGVGSEPKASDMFDDFFTELRDLNNGAGYPIQCKKIAISNGVKTGLKQLDANGNPFGTTLALQADLSNNLFSMTVFSWPDNSTAIDPIDSETRISLYQRFFALTGPTEQSIFIEGVLPVDNCPGGTTPLNSEIADVLNAIPGITTTVNAPNTTFIPTMSALDIDIDLLSDLTSDIDLQCQIPFDAHYAPLLANQQHTDFEAETANWLFEQITDNNWTITQANNRSFNFGGNTTDIIFRDVTVESNGELLVNDNRFTDFFGINGGGFPEDNSTFIAYTAGCKADIDITIGNTGRLWLGSPLDDLSGHLHIRENDNLKVENGGETRLRTDSKLFADEGGSVLVQPGGVLRVQDNSEVVVNDGGTMIVENNASVILEDNAIIRIQDGGELILDGFNQLTAQNAAQIIIEDGGKLTYEEDASIDLTTSNNILTIKGKLAVEDDAIFSFSGDGHLVFDQNLWKTDPNTGQLYQALDDYWEIGEDAEFNLEGGQVFSDVIMETKKSFVPKMSDGTTFAKMTFKRGQVLIGETAPLHCFGALEMLNVEVNTADPSVKHDGFRLHYSTGVRDISNVRFKNGKKSLIAHWYGSSIPLVLNSTSFSDNDIGFYCDRGNFELNNTDFFNNITGVDGYTITGSSQINNSVFNGNQTGVFAIGQAGTTLTSTSSNYLSNGTGINGIQLDLISKCSKYVDNTGNGIEVIDSKVYLNDDAANQFYNNQHAVYLSGYGSATGIYLDEGKNEFGLGAQGASYNFSTMPTKTYIYGILTDSKPQSLYDATLTDHILADDNKMPFITVNPISGPANLPMLPIDIQYTTGSGPTIQYHPVFLSIPNNPSVITSECSNISFFDDDLPASHIIQGIPDEGDPLGGGKWVGKTVKEALLLSIENITVGEEPLDDLLALDDLQEILLQKTSSSIYEENELLKIAYSLMQMAFGNAYTYGQLVNTENNAQSMEPAVSRTISIIDDILNDLNSSSATYYSENFVKTLDKAHSYRIGGYYDEALAVLATDNQWAAGNDLIRTGFWTCICSAEKDYVEDVIDEESLLNVLTVCNQTYIGYNYKKDNDKPVSYYQSLSKEQLQVSLYPQPVNDHLKISLNQDYSGNVVINIFDVTGKQVFSQNINWNGNSQSINLSELSAGTYAIEALFDSKHEISEKLIIE